MDTNTVTLIAASIAALTSIVSLLFSFRNQLKAETRAALRAPLEKNINALGNELYSIVAISKRMGMASDDATYQDRKATATESARNIDELRRDTRYFLWGLNDGIHAMVLLPKYVNFPR